MAKYGSWRLEDVEQLLDIMGEDNARKVVKGELLCRFSSVELPRFPVTIDYPNPPNLLVEQLKESSQVNFINQDITAEHFPVKGSGIGVVFLTLVDFGQTISTRDVLAKFKEMGIENPNIEHCLAFAGQYPSEQRKGPIAVLCKPWKDEEGEYHIPYLDGEASARYLHLHDFNCKWEKRWRFLAVRT